VAPGAENGNNNVHTSRASLALLTLVVLLAPLVMIGTTLDSLPVISHQQVIDVPQAPQHPTSWKWLFGEGSVLFGMAASPYAGLKTGRNVPVPILPNGQVDINSIMGGYVDRGVWQYYDTLKLGPGATVSNSYEFFAVAKGQPDPNNGNIVKTYVETNLLTANQFNPPRDMIMKALCFMVETDARLYDINQIFKHSYFEFKIDEKVFFQGDLKFQPSGVGITGMSTQTSESAWTNGISNVYATRRFGDYSKYIAPLQRFSLTLYFPETINQLYNSVLTASQTAAGQSGTALPTLLTANQGGNGLWLKPYIDGLTDRAVQ
jgi:hypothetical protein